MWTTIITLICFVLIKFLFDLYKQTKKLKTTGGVKEKYSTLINLLQSNSNPIIFHSDNNIYSFGWKFPHSDNRFRIIEAFGSVDINWEFSGKLSIMNQTINLKKKWKFPEDKNQEEMARIIIDDMNEAYNNSPFGQL